MQEMYHQITSVINPFITRTMSKLIGTCKAAAATLDALLATMRWDKDFTPRSTWKQVKTMADTKLMNGNGDGLKSHTETLTAATHAVTLFTEGFGINVDGTYVGDWNASHRTLQAAHTMDTEAKVFLAISTFPDKIKLGRYAKKLRDAYVKKGIGDCLNPMVKEKIESMIQMD